MGHAIIENRRTKRKAQASGLGWSSSNWSGYAITRRAGTITSISGEWNVPRVARSSRTAYSANWIGIDGFSNSSLIQVGTEQDYEGGAARYYAWWEILPALETRIPYRVAPGDRMRAEIRALGNRRWSIRLWNVTRKWVFRIVRTYSGPQASAEWIVEAPQVNGQIATFARIGRTTFRSCRVNGRNPQLTLADGGSMKQGGRVVAKPTAPNRGGDGFSVDDIASGSARAAHKARRRSSAMTKLIKPLLLIG